MAHDINKVSNFTRFTSFTENDTRNSRNTDQGQYLTCTQPHAYLASVMSEGKARRGFQVDQLPAGRSSQAAPKPQNENKPENLTSEHTPGRTNQTQG